MITKKIIRIKREKIVGILLFLILLLGAGLRFYDLGAKEFESTEVAIAMQMKIDLWEMVQKRLSFGKSPFHCLIQRAATKIFGLNEFSLRFISAWGGIFSIYIIFLIGKLCFPSRIALTAAFLFSVSRVNLYYSQWAKPNAICSFFILLSILFFIKAIEENKRNFWRKYVLFRVIATYLYGMVFFVYITEFLYVLLFSKRLHIKRDYMVSLGHILLFLSPLLACYFLLASRSALNGAPLIMYDGESPITFLLYLGRSYLKLGRLAHGVFLYPLFCVLGIIYGFTDSRKDSERAGSVDISFYKKFFLIFCLIIPVFIAQAITYFFYPVFNFSYLIMVEGFYLIFVAAGCFSVIDIVGKLKVKPEFKILCKTVLFLAIMAVLLLPRISEIRSFYLRNNAQWRDAILYLRENSALDEEIVMVPWPRARYAGYYYPGIEEKMQDKRIFSAPDILISEGRYLFERGQHLFFKKNQRFWLLVEMKDTQVKPVADYEKKLKEIFLLLEKKEFLGLSVYHLEKKDDSGDVFMEEVVLKKKRDKLCK